MKNNYLATIVFDPKGSDGSTDEMIPKLSEIIVSVDGEVQKVESQGTHDFAYPQKGKANAKISPTQKRTPALHAHFRPACRG